MHRTRDLIRLCLCALGVVAVSTAGHALETELDRTLRNAMVFAPAGNLLVTSS
jgi:hypothetical protein